MIHRKFLTQFNVKHHNITITTNHFPVLHEHQLKKIICNSLKGKGKLFKDMNA